MEEELLNEIEELREEMTQLVKEHGINHPLVLKLSQKMDALHIQLIKHQLEDNSK